MNRPFEIQQGKAPLLVSFPHSGTELPSTVATTMTKVAQGLPDTDWYLPRLYEGPALERCSQLHANFSRYLIDPNRPPDGSNLYPGQPTPELCPLKTFAGDSIYQEAAPSDEVVQHRLAEYWAPYHNALQTELQRIREQFGFAVLLDAHSIASQVPRLFEGRLPDLNLGTGGGVTCGAGLTNRLQQWLRDQSNSSILNGRFIGGYITRNYGRPQNDIHAVQLELSQATYLDEPSAQWDETKAQQIRPVIHSLLQLLSSEDPVL